VQLAVAQLETIHFQRELFAVKDSWTAGLRMTVPSPQVKQGGEDKTVEQDYRYVHHHNQSLQLHSILHARTGGRGQFSTAN
jgi:hypothetical protein